MLYGRVRALSPLVVDGLLALLVTGVAFASLVAKPSQALLAPEEGVRYRSVDALAVALLLLSTLPITWRRRYPLLVLVLSGAAFLAYQALGYAAPALPFAPLIALYTVAASCTSPISVTAAAALVVGIAVVEVTHRDPLGDDQLLAYLVSVVAAWMLGYGLQLSRVRTSLLEAQAMRLAREQADQTRLAVEREQARIARELHDIVAHHVSVIVAQAGAAQRVFDAEPAQARQALGWIETTGREALVELRRLLGVLRTDQGEPERAPQPGLGHLLSLLAQVRQAGLPVELVLQGDPRPLPAGIELSAYRIVQEALTNTLKHAGPTRATVVLGFHPEVLELQICDDGQGGTPDLVYGHGLVGMQQRAALLGGELLAGPGSGGGFQVTARLPVNGERP